MKHRALFILIPIGLAVALLVAVTTLQPVQAQGEIFYVNANTGDDSRTPAEAQNPETPWQTITHAAATVPAGEAINPNTIQVAAGTYDTALGESFPITFTNPYIQLLGDPAGTTTIDGGGTATIIEIDVEGIHIEGFSILNASGEGIYATTSPVIVGNIFDSVLYGIDVYINETISANWAVPDIIINNNVLTTTGDAISIFAYLNATDLPLEIEFGAVTVNSNTINLDTNAFYGIKLSTSGVENLDGGSVTAGPIDVSANQITGGVWGIEYYGSFVGLTDSTVAAADLSFHNNVLRSQTYMGLFIDYYDADQIAGDSSVALGNLSMIGNDIRCNLSGCTSIFGDYGNFTNMNGNASISTGNITVTANTVDAYYGIHLPIESIDHLSDQSMVTGDDFWFSNNVVSATHTGIMFYYDDVARENSGDSQTLLGNIHILDNQITTANHGISIQYGDSAVGNDNTGNAYIQLPSYQIQGNSISANGVGYGLSLLNENNPSNTEDNTMLDFGNLNVSDNVFNNNSSGVFLRMNNICTDCNNGSGAKIGNILVTDNTFTGQDSSIYMVFDELGYEFDYTGTLTMEDVLIVGNVISADGGAGINVFTSILSSAEAEVTAGNLEVRENEIYSSTPHAIDISTHQETYDDGILSVGETIVADNRIEECSYAAINLTSNKQESSSVPTTQGDLFADGNTVLGCNHGINIGHTGPHQQTTHLTNNIIADPEEVAISLLDVTQAEILHNTLIGSGTADAGISVYSSTVGITDTIVVSFTTAIDVSPGTHLSNIWEDYNLLSWNDVTTNSRVTSGGNSLIDLDPAFADPVNDDYHITLGSAALNTGVDAGIDWDIDGDGRPARGSFDIGADEYPYAIFFEPDRSGSGLLGETVVYTHTLANSGTTTDTFVLSHTSTLGWNVNYDTPIVLGPMSSAEVTVNVNIPTDALSEQVETMILTAASQSDPSIMASVTVTTTVLEVPGNSIYLPLITKE